MLRDKTMLPLAVLFLLNLVELHVQAEGQAALFYKNDVLDPQHQVQENQQVARQARQSLSPTDITVRNILQWLQQRSNKDKESKESSKDLGRKARDNGEVGLPARTYLPAEVPIPVNIPFQTSAPPRPFEPNPTPTQPPQPQPLQPVPQLQPQRPAPQPKPRPQPPYQPVPPPGFPSPTQYPGALPSTLQTLAPTQLPPISDGDSGSYGYPYQPVPAPGFPGPTQHPAVLPGTLQTLPPAQLPPISDSGSGGYVVPQEEARPAGSDTAIPPGSDETQHQAPHIHQINVQCAKDNMIITIEFDRIFNGIIYSKGFYTQNACRYVKENSGQKEYSLQVRLDSCGTQFVDQLKEGGQAYLENVLVMQNEVGIQEVWDTVRSVRCQWEGNINKALSADLNVDMLQQEVVTFSGDTAVAKLDIQMGQGPFAPAATGLVKIGEPMTLVITVEGDPGFDIVVHECTAKDSTGANSVQLTDERGCILRPKLMSPFQKTRDPSTSAVIAYANFQAFKFPDVMDLTMECNVELCKADCQPTCTEFGQIPDRLVRRRRDLSMDNSTLVDPVRIHRSFWVVSPDDIQDPKGATVINLGSYNEGVCMSVPGFILTSMLLLSVLIASSVLCAYLWLKREPKHLVARTIHLDSFPGSKA